MGAQELGKLAAENLEYYPPQAPTGSLVPPTLAEFRAELHPEPEALIGPIGTQQIVLAAAAAGVGKTQFAVALTMALKNGSDWLHWEVPKPRSVLYIDGEMPPRLLQERFSLYHDAGIGEARVINAISFAAKVGMGHPNLAEPQWQELISGWATGFDVVVVDNVMSLVSVPGESMSSDGFWKPVYDWSLKERAAGRTTLILDHTNANGEVFGTKTKRWNADLCFSLESPADHEHSEGCRFTVRFNKTRGKFGKEVSPFEARMTTDEHGQAHWTHRWVEEALMEEAWNLSKEGRPQRDIADKLGLNATKVNRLLKKARETGLP